MAQIHVNVPDHIKIDAENELKKHGKTLTIEVRAVLYRLARLNNLSKQMNAVPRERRPLTNKAKKDLSDDSTAISKRSIKS